MKKLLILSLIGLFIVGCYLIKQPAQKVDRNYARVEIAGRVFKIHKGYFDGAPTGRDTESILLEYILPDFDIAPKYAYESDARWEFIKQGRKRGLLLEAEKNRPSFDDVMPNILSISTTRYFRKTNDNYYGLEKYVDDFHDPVDDLLIERGNNNKAVSIMRCTSVNQKKFIRSDGTEYFNRICGHYFNNKGLRYKTSWPITELPNWQKQRDAVIAFIDSLEHKEN